MMFNFALVVLMLSVFYHSTDCFSIDKANHYLTKRSDYSDYNGGGLGSNDYGDIEETEDSYIIPAYYFNEKSLKQVCEYCDSSNANQKMKCDKNTNSNAGTGNTVAAPIATAIDSINVIGELVTMKCSPLSAANNLKINIGGGSSY